MWAVTIVDRELRWQEHPDPRPGTGQVLVAVRAAGVNNADLMQLGGYYPAPPGNPPDIPGLELAGEVVGLGPSADRFRVGDRVMAVVGGGGQAELAVLHERHAMPVPEALDWDAAGGFPEAFTTAHDALFSQCGLTMGDRLLVNGAAGGVGSAAVQLGVAAGASVVATIRRESQREALAGLGAEVWVTGLGAAGVGGTGPGTAGVGGTGLSAAGVGGTGVGGTGVGGTGPGTAGVGGTGVGGTGARPPGPFDVILELVGAPNMAHNVASLATLGRIAVVGTGAGSKAELDLGRLMSKRGRIYSSTLRARSLEDKAAAARAVELHVLGLLADRRVHVPLAATWSMSEAAAAYEQFRAGGKVGKIVLQHP